MSRDGYDRLWKAIRNFADQKQFTVSIPLGTGYKVSGELDARVSRLRSLCEDAVTRKEWQPTEKSTFCNFASAWFANHYGFSGLKGKLANDQVRALKDNPSWEVVDTTTAIKQARFGSLVLAGKEYDDHGHIATCYPGISAYSGTWAKEVPLVANVGRNNGVMPCSQAFPVRQGEPFYFLLRSSRHE